MPALSLRDRLLTPRVARAMLSPTAILAAGGGAAVGIVAGGGPIGAVVLGALAWMGRVALAIPRRQPAEGRIDPFALDDPWRSFVRDAQQAKARFDEAIGRTKAGPLRDRLAEIGAQLEDGVSECWRVARRGQALVEARRQIDTGDAFAQLKTIEAQSGEHWAKGSSIERTAQALRSQVETANRMDRVIAETHDQLQLLDARLDEAVVRSIELSVSAESPDALGGLGEDVDGIVGDLEALRQALEEAGGASRG